MADELEFPRTMGAEDALLWSAESDPLLRSTVAAVTVLDGTPDRAVLRARLEGASRALPRLRQRVLVPPRALSLPIWSEDPNFDLDFHLRWIRAAGPDPFRNVLDFAAATSMQGFDRMRPLWEFTVVEGLEDGRAAVVQKLHHAITDGAGGIVLMQKVYDLERNAALPPSPGGEDDPPDPGSALLEMLEVGAQSWWEAASAAPGTLWRGAARALDAVTQPLDTLRGALGDLGSLAHLLSPAGEPLSPLLRRRSSRYRFDALAVPVAGLKAAAHAADCKLNDAFLAAVASGFRRYHDRHGVRVSALRASVPVSLRSGAGGVAGNRMMPTRVLLPLRIADPRERMRRIRELVRAEREQPALAYVEAVSGALGYVPQALLARVLGRAARGIDCVAACVPGLPMPLHLAGARVDSFFTFGPTAGTGANVTLFSYRDEAAVAINADPAALPDHELLLECLREGFDEVLKQG